MKKIFVFTVFAMLSSLGYAGSEFPSGNVSITPTPDGSVMIIDGDAARTLFEQFDVALLPRTSCAGRTLIVSSSMACLMERTEQGTSYVCRALILQSGSQVPDKPICPDHSIIGVSN
jgi:hypothetical protein